MRLIRVAGPPVAGTGTWGAERLGELEGGVAEDLEGDVVALHELPLVRRILRAHRGDATPGGELRREVAEAAALRVQPRAPGMASHSGRRASASPVRG